MTAQEKLARMLGTSPEALQQIDIKVLESVIQQNDSIVQKTLTRFGLTPSSSAQEVSDALMKELTRTDEHLFEILGRPDLAQLSLVCGKLCETALQVYTPPKGFFIKKEKVVALLEKYKPENILNHFGYANVAELVEKEGFASVVAALRFVQTQEWMHKFFDEAYSSLNVDDFEERDVELKVLDAKWLDVAEKFLEKKYHNVSHLKEFGVIFVTPLKIDTPGETIRMFTLLIHYLHEVPFYSDLFRKFQHDSDFIAKLNSLLRGDVPEGNPPAGGAWRIVQRYLAKDDENDFRLKEPHVNPEAEHWYKAEQALNRFDANSFGQWFELDFVGDFFPPAGGQSGQEVFVSFDLVDLIMSLVKKGEIKYLYHQKEALWNKIFSEFMGRDKMNQLIEENIIKGFIEL